MADVRLDQENVLSDYDYLLAVKGNDVVRISKKDQATVAGELCNRMPGFFTDKIRGSANQPIDIAKECVAAISTEKGDTAFSLLYTSGTSYHVYGLLYFAKDVGVINIQKHDGTFYRVKLSGGVYSIL